MTTQKQFRSLLRAKSAHKIRIKEFEFREIFYPQRLHMARHPHDTPFISFVLEGGYREKINHKSLDRVANKVIFHTAQESHSVNFNDTLTRIFQIDLTPEWFQDNKNLASIFDHPHEFTNDPLCWTATRIYSEYKLGDEFSALSIEGLMLEILTIAGRLKASSTESTPRNRWLVRAKEILSERFDSKVSVEEIAREVGVHPVHLSREFRRQTGVTIGEYIRRRRIEVACEKLSCTDLGLSYIGESVGFYDQSHFINNFKRITGLTPRAYRIAMARS